MLFSGTASVASAQRNTDFRAQVIDAVLSMDEIRSQVDFLADSICAGRATSTRGAVEASAWIVRHFDRYGLMPFGDHFVRSFAIGEKTGHNVVGIAPSSVPCDRYMIVAAHFDNLGVLSGNMYPGADSNASGVVAMLSLAHIIRSMSVFGVAGSCNVIFVGLDAKQQNMAGADALYDDIVKGRLVNPTTGRIVRREQIEMMVNLDVIGSTLEPVNRQRKDYLIMLGGNESHRRLLSATNYDTRSMMDLSFDYYGSPNFTDLFLNRVSDQKVFIENGVTSVLFTSGVTMLTNKQEDTADTLDIPMLYRRILLIYNWLERLMN